MVRFPATPRAWVHEKVLPTSLSFFLNLQDGQGNALQTWVVCFSCIILCIFGLLNQKIF